MANKPFFASTMVPLIQSFMSGMLKLPSEKDARDKLEIVKNSFITPKKQPNDNPNSLYLWIKGYAVTEENTKDGYLGNFVNINIVQKDDFFTLELEKIDIPPAQHPQRVRKPQTHPNWGHPLLRNVKKEKIYETIEEVRTVLEKLHEEFPKTTIPLTNKTYAMIYDGKLPADKRVQKWVLEIQLQKEGGYKIECSENKYDPLTRVKPKPKKEFKKDSEKPIEERKSKGFFTSLMAMKKKPK